MQNFPPLGGVLGCGTQPDGPIPMPKARTFPILALLLAAVLVGVRPAAGGSSAENGDVEVNGQRLTPAELALLEKVNGGPVPEGAYWYDRTSGLWGHLGGPAAGAIAAGLEIGGPLAPDASGGTTGVFFNGREITSLELYRVSQHFGILPKGRYWLDAQGRGGLEGGPPAFVLRQAPDPSGQGGNSTGGWSTHGTEDTEWPGFRIQN